MWDIEKYLSSKGYIIIAHGADGSNSSWVLAIDPKDPRHIQFLREWCASYSFLTGALLQRQRPLRQRERQLYEEVMENLLAVLGTDPGNLAFTIWDDELEVAFRLVNEKVRLVKDPCTLLRGVEGDLIVQPMASFQFFFKILLESEMVKPSKCR